MKLWIKLIPLMFITAFDMQGVYAQALEPGQTVRTRARPDYDPSGIRLRSFNVFPKMTVDAIYDDNIRAVEKDSPVYLDDRILLIVPELGIRSDWSRHELGGGAWLRSARYDEFDNQDFDDYRIWLDGALDMRDSQLSLRGSHNRLHEPTTSPNFREAALEPTKFTSDRAGVTYRLDPNRAFIQVAVDFNRIDFQDDVLVPGSQQDPNNDDRDRDVTDLRLRAGYNVSPATGLFLQARSYEFDYRTDADRNGNNRDQDGYDLVVGAELNFSGVTFGEVFLGYRNVEFADPRFDSQNGPLVGANVDWNITHLTTVTLGAAQRLRGSTVAGASGIEALNLSVEVDHELRRNIILTLDLEAVNEDFLNIEREDDVLLFRLGAEYSLNRYWGLNLGYRFEERESNDAGAREFELNQLYFGVVGRI